MARQGTGLGDLLRQPDAVRIPLSVGALVAGRYRLDRLLGEGGMGVVWAATHSITRKPVALKFLKAGAHSADARRRFLREARVAAAIRHPNVIEVHDVLELDSGSPVIVMELLSGESLASRLQRERSIPLAEAASILLRVVEALESAHDLGVVHRDLKPENIFLVGGSSQRVKVLDFGIAKLTATEGHAARSADLTSTGAMIGTPCYMAPEQAFGEQEIDHRADIWALGLILYECLSGVLPTRAENLGQIFKILLTDAIPPLGEVVPDIPTEVGALVGRMLSRQREARPAGLWQVTSVLARHAGAPAPDLDPPSAPDAPPLDPLADTERRHGVESGGEPAPFAEAAPTEHADRAARAHGAGGLSLPAPEAISPMIAATSACHALAYRPDGALLTTAHDNGTAYVWDAATGAGLRAFQGHTACVFSVAVSPDGQLLATGSADSTVRIWHLATGRCLSVLKGHSSAVRGVAFTPDGQRIASAGDTTVRLWAVTGGAALQVFKEHSAALRSVAVSPDGQRLAAGGPDGSISLWHAATGKVLTLWKSLRAPVRCLAFHPDGQTLASCGDSAVRLWNAASGQALQVLRGHSASLRSVAFSPDGQTLASGGDDRTIRLWKATSGELLRVLQGHTGVVRSLAFSPDGQTLASGADDHPLTLWNLGTGRARHYPKAQPPSLYSVAVSPDGQTLAAGDNDRSIAIWQLATGRLQRVLEAPPSPVRSLAFSPDGQTLASGSDDRSIAIVQLATGQVQRVLEGHAGAVSSLAFSPDGQTLASGSNDRSISLWQLATGQIQRVLEGHAGAVRSLAFSPDGQTLASGADDQSVRLWSPSTRKPRLILRSRAVAHGLALPVDGSAVHAAGDDGAVLWRVTGDELQPRVSGHATSFVSVALSLSLDHQVLVGAARDGTLHLCDVTTGRCHARLLRLPDGWVAFTPDGRYKLGGRVDSAFWHAADLCRFEPGELDAQLPAPLRLPDDAPLVPPSDR